MRFSRFNFWSFYPIAWLMDKASTKFMEVVARNSKIEVSNEVWDTIFGVAHENECTVLDLLAELLIAEVARITEIEDQYNAMQDEEEASHQMAIDAKIDREIEDFVYHQGVDADIEAKLST